MCTMSNPTTSPALLSEDPLTTYLTNHDSVEDNLLTSQFNIPASSCSAVATIGTPSSPRSIRSGVSSVTQSGSISNYRPQQTPSASPPFGCSGECFSRPTQAAVFNLQKLPNSRAHTHGSSSADSRTSSAVAVAADESCPDDGGVTFDDEASNATDSVGPSELIPDSSALDDKSISADVSRGGPQNKGDPAEPLLNGQNGINRQTPTSPKQLLLNQQQQQQQNQILSHTSQPAHHRPHGSHLVKASHSHRPHQTPQDISPQHNHHHRFPSSACGSLQKSCFPSYIPVDGCCIQSSTIHPSSVQNDYSIDNSEPRHGFESGGYTQNLNELGEFQVTVESPDIKFNCAHFVAYDGYRERLHGHNYTVSMNLGGPLNFDGYVVDFTYAKRVLREICRSLNEYMIVPMKSDVLQITLDDVSVHIKTQDSARFMLPKTDCLCLPLMHSTAEELSAYIWHQLVVQMTPQFLQQRGIRWMEIVTAERPTQRAHYKRHIPEGPLL